jgi:integrase
MRFRLVRPMLRKGSSFPYFIQRIPADVKDQTLGLRLAVPIGDSTIPVTITERSAFVRLSLRTRDAGEAKVRQGQVAGLFENVWRALREDKPVRLTHRQATALAGELYRAWARGEDGERVMAIEHVEGQGWQRTNSYDTEEEHQATWAATRRHWERVGNTGEAGDLEKPLGPIVDRLLLAKGIRRVDEASRAIILLAFWRALSEAFETRERQAGGDYSHDAKSERFPKWKPPASTLVVLKPPSKHSLMGLVDGWWREAEAVSITVSTHESYRNTMKRLVVFLRHDDASRVTVEDVLAFKDHRLGEMNIRTGKPISAKTIKDSDLAGLKAVFGWAVRNRRIPTNPAQGVTIKLGKKVRTRSKGFTEDEATTILTHAIRHERGGKREKTFAAARWAPWLCAYTGARIGEVVQLRKQDIRHERGRWIMTITPEAGTVKTKEAREVPLHPHLVELGFPGFVENAPDGYLFLTPSPDGSVRGSWEGVKNRVAEFVREVITDRRVAPNHAWRHLFKTIGFEADIQERVLDAICGHAPRTVGGTYGEVTLRAKADAIARFPRFLTA